MPDPNRDTRPWRRNEPDSPCIAICQIHPTHGICIGCHRTTDEIADWSRMGPEARRSLLAVLPERGAGLHKRRGGRAARLSQRL